LSEVRIALLLLTATLFPVAVAMLVNKGAHVCQQRFALLHRRPS